MRLVMRSTMKAHLIAVNIPGRSGGHSTAIRRLGTPGGPVDCMTKSEPPRLLARSAIGAKRTCEPRCACPLSGAKRSSFSRDEYFAFLTRSRHHAFSGARLWPLRGCGYPALADRIHKNARRDSAAISLRSCPSSADAGRRYIRSCRVRRR